MELKQFLLLIKAKIATILVIILGFLILAAIVTVLQPFKYGASAKLLIIQNTKVSDAFAQSKANEFISNILVRVAGSNSFYNQALAAGFNIDKKYFPGGIKEQMKAWDKTVDPKPINDTGIIALNIYHRDKSQADQLAQAVIYTLQTKHTLYLGAGDNIAIKVIDEPITSNFPVKPNIIFNFILAVAGALTLAFTYIYLFPEQKFNLLVWPDRAPKRATIRQIPRADESVKETPNNWQAVGDILNQRAAVQPEAVAAAPAVVIKQVREQEEFLEIKRRLIDDLAPAAPAGTEEEKIEQEIYEDIIKNGNMANIFGKQKVGD